MLALIFTLLVHILSFFFAIAILVISINVVTDIFAWIGIGVVILMLYGLAKVTEFLIGTALNAIMNERRNDNGEDN